MDDGVCSSHVFQLCSVVSEIKLPGRLIVTDRAFLLQYCKIDDAFYLPAKEK